MSELDSIVAVSISANSRNPSRTGFGTPCIMTYHTAFTDDVYREYTNTADMVADGFATYDDAYRMAAACFSQTPCPDSVIVGRLTSAPSFQTELTITDATEGNHIQCTVLLPATGAEFDIDYTILAAATTSTVATAVEAEIEAITGVNSSAASEVITITPATAGRKVIVKPIAGCKVKEITADAGYDDALTALQVVNDDWYFVLTNSSSDANIKAVAAWALANDSPKLYFANTESSYEMETQEAGKTGFDIKALGNDRCVLIYGANPEQFSAAAWVGVGAPQDAGGITYALKALDGVTPDTLTTTQKGHLESANINHYMSVSSLGVTRKGVTLEGEFIDIIHGTDALTADIQESVFALLASQKKIAYTINGFAAIEGTILAACKRFEGDEALLVPDSSVVIMPDPDDVSAANKALRALPGIRFSADYSGAVHSASIVGTLTL